jgi:hypothetical protein
MVASQRSLVVGVALFLSGCQDGGTLATVVDASGYSTPNGTVADAALPSADLSSLSVDASQPPADASQPSLDAGQLPPDLMDASDGGGSGTTSLSGNITSEPLAVNVPGLDVARLPVLDVYWLENQSDWYSDLEWCATAYGSSSTTYSFSVQAGSVTLLESYCTAGATQYQLATRPAIVNLQGPISGFPVIISNSSIGVSPLPSLAVFFSNDGTTWYADGQACAQAYGSSTVTQSFVVSNGQIVLLQNYCTANAKYYQVSTRPGRRVLQGNITSWPVTLNDASFSAGALPNIAVFWSDDGTDWYSLYERCAQSYGSSTTTRSFVVSNGQIVLPQNYCTANAKYYQIVIDDS